MLRSYGDGRVALIMRRLRAHFGVAAPQVSVSVQLPWRWRAGFWTLVIALVIGVAWWAYDSGRHKSRFLAGDDGGNLDTLRSANAALEEELAKYRGLLAASESRLQIEQAAQKSISEKNASLIAENAKLKEELAVIEKLVRMESKGKSDDEVSLDRIVIKQDFPPGKYRWSFFVDLEGKRRGREVKLNLQMVVMTRGGDKITLPQVGDPDMAQFQFVVRNFKRVEGKFALPAGKEAVSVEFKVFEAGALKATKIQAI